MSGSLEAVIYLITWLIYKSSILLSFHSKYEFLVLYNPAKIKNGIFKLIMKKLN